MDPISDTLIDALEAPGTSKRMRVAMGIKLSSTGVFHIRKLYRSYFLCGCTSFLSQ